MMDQSNVSLSAKLEGDKTTVLRKATGESPPITPRDVKIRAENQGPDTPPPKRLKQESTTTPGEIKVGARDVQDNVSSQVGTPATPAMHTEPLTTKETIVSEEMTDSVAPKTPVSVVDRPGSTSPSDLSSSSREKARELAMSPLTPYVHEVPPAPPSTPASDANAITAFRDAMLTPIPYAAVQNADQLERQQLLAEGAVTPAPARPNQPPKQKQPSLVDDFSEWAVGDRYKLQRMLGRGSYGEVAQALDLYQGKTDAYVAIKRIQSPFDQEVDAVRLFREIHILRRLRGHECVIQLLDVVQPPSEDLNDFHDLYLVFECKYATNNKKKMHSFLKNLRSPNT